MASIFTKIIRGEIPSHSVYEDRHAFAFLDINPRQPGHTLVVPKTEVDYLFDLPADEYDALWRAARTVAEALRATTRCARVVVVVLGYEVPHAHIHLIPSNELGDLPFPPVVEQDQDELGSMAAAIRDALGDPGYGADTALVVVDVQNDFADPDGSLYVPGAETLVPRINREVDRALAAGSLVAYTQDWHPADTPHFAKDGGTWPVHCVAGTWGAEFHPALAVEDGIPVVRKGIRGEDGYSGFSMADPETPGDDPIPTGLEDLLRSGGTRRIVLAGLATDYCVKETTLDAIRLGFEVTVLAECVGAVDLSAGDGDRALEAMRAAGASIE